VISIIALLSSVVLVAVKTAREKAQISKARSEMAEFVKALEIYRTSYGHYPYSSNCVFFSSSSWGEICTSYNDTTQDEFTSIILNELKTKKIYSGDLITTLKSLPNYGSYWIAYTSTPTGMTNMLNDYGTTPVCNTTNAFTREYYLTFIINDKGGIYIPGFNGTYIGKEYTFTYFSGEYCSPNN
jgi:type II secretory pathway pseudopilin PulG